MALDYDQQTALAIANIAFQEGDTIKDMDRIATSGQIIGNQDVYDLYMNYHHTKSGK
jgi:peptidase E